MNQDGDTDRQGLDALADLPVDTPLPNIRICVDGRMLRDEGTGVARYARTLVDALSEAGVPPLLLHADLHGASRMRRWFASARLRERFAQDRSGCTVTTADRSIVARDVFREAQIHFNLYGRLMPISCSGPPGVMHWTYPVPVIMRGWCNVYTVHDVIPLAGDGLSPIRASRHRKMLRAIARHADRLVTVSQSARAEIIEALRCDPSFVTSVSQAVSITSEAEAVPEIGDARDYFLFCGSIEPRKNLSRLAEAYRQSGVGRKLVIVGSDGWRADSVRRMLQHGNILVLPYQPRERLAGLIKHARALLFPSLSEGFGLPVVEAMSLGTPVMTSARGATAEVAGGAALLVDPYDIDDIARAIRRLDEDDALCDSLGTAGLRRSMEFRALPYAHRLIAMYADLLNGPAR